jgi:hypothetical protein
MRSPKSPQFQNLHEAVGTFVYDKVGYYLGFPIWFLSHDRRGTVFVILVIFVLLHRFASRFLMSTVAFSAAREVF